MDLCCAGFWATEANLVSTAALHFGGIDLECFGHRVDCLKCCLPVDCLGSDVPGQPQQDELAGRIVLRFVRLAEQLLGQGLLLRCGLGLGIFVAIDLLEEFGCFGLGGGIGNGLLLAASWANAGATMRRRTRIVASWFGSGSVRVTIKGDSTTESMPLQSSGTHRARRLPSRRKPARSLPGGGCMEPTFNFYEAISRLSKMKLRFQKSDQIPGPSRHFIESRTPLRMQTAIKIPATSNPKGTATSVSSPVKTANTRAMFGPSSRSAQKKATTQIKANKTQPIGLM